MTTGPRLPVLMDLRGRSCLVVGGGEVATRKAMALLGCEAQVTVCASGLSAPLQALADAGALALAPGPYLGLATVPTPPGGWWFVVAATDQPDVNARVVADAARTGTWANDASVGDGGPASLAATWRSGPVTVAVSTSGVHPGAARWLCDLLADQVEPEVVAALELVEEVRAEDRAAGGPGRRPDWRRAVDSGMLECIRAGQLAEAKERLQACLSSSSD